MVPVMSMSRSAANRFAATPWWPHGLDFPALLLLLGVVPQVIWPMLPGIPIGVWICQPDKDGAHCAVALDCCSRAIYGFTPVAQSQ